MNGSPNSVLTLGLGSWGSVGLVVTLGYGIASVIGPPFCVVASQAHVPGSVCAQSHVPGSATEQSHVPGSTSAQSC